MQDCTKQGNQESSPQQPVAPACLQGLDIGPDSIKLFNDALSDTKTVVWNGPMGVFEFDKFAAGTMARLHSPAILQA